MMEMHRPDQNSILCAAIIRAQNKTPMKSKMASGFKDFIPLMQTNAMISSLMVQFKNTNSTQIKNTFKKPRLEVEGETKS